MPLVVALDNVRQAGILERFAKIYVSNREDFVTKNLVDNLTKQSFVKNASQNGSYGVKLLSSGVSVAGPYASPYMDVYAMDNALKCDSAAWQRYVHVGKPAPAWTHTIHNAVVSAGAATNASGITGTASNTGQRDTGLAMPSASASVPGHSSIGTESAHASNHVGGAQNDGGAGRPVRTYAGAVGANASPFNSNSVAHTQSAPAPAAVVASKMFAATDRRRPAFLVAEFLFAYERKALNGKHSNVLMNGLRCTFQAFNAR